MDRDTVPQDDQKSKSLLDISLAAFANYDIWLRETSAVIYSNNDFMLFMRNADGWCTVRAMRDGAKLTERRYSKELAVGYFDPTIGDWVESDRVYRDYPQWAAQTKVWLGYEKPVEVVPDATISAAEMNERRDVATYDPQFVRRHGQWLPKY